MSSAQTFELKGVPVTLDGHYWVNSREDAKALCPVNQPIYFRDSWDSERECWIVPPRRTTECARRAYLCVDCDYWTDCTEFSDTEGRCFVCYDENKELWKTILEDRPPSSIVHRAMAHLIDRGDVLGPGFEHAMEILLRAVIEVRIGWTEPQRVA